MHELFTHTLCFVAGIFFTFFVLWLIAKVDGVDATPEEVEEQIKKVRDAEENKNLD